jgi:hypothetical protein
MTVRILVTVSRSWSEWSTMRAALTQVHGRYPDAVLVHGNAPRGDRQAGAIWRGMGGGVELWPAKWMEHGDDCRCTDRTRRCKYAGFRRNIAMVESAPDLCLAFIHRNSAGASHCARTADDAGITVVRYVQGDEEQFAEGPEPLVTVELPPMPGEEP